MEESADFNTKKMANLPPRVKLLSFATDRINEIKAMERALKTTTATKLAFQQLPRHMRRRVMAHNTKRLPRRLRQIHLSQLKKSGMPLKQKRPSRKYRRRPRNLLSEYANRQRRVKWLETHLWHAKRFHLIEKWNYRLPNKPCDKSFRACYRATSMHSLVQDVSYISCIEITGIEDTLVTTLKKITMSSGLSIGAKAYFSGSREGTTVIFDDNKPLGTVNFHWKPCSTDGNRTIWLWVHAAYYKSTLNCLSKSFNLKRVKSKLHSFKNDETLVTLTELKNSLNRFRLTGPLSSAVIYNACKIANMSQSEWFLDFTKSEKNSASFCAQKNYWEIVGNAVPASELSPHQVLCLTVNDPRYNLPRTKTKALLQLGAVSKPMELPENLASGAIWEQDIRLLVKKNKLSNAKLCEMRSELLVPGSSMGEGEAVPIVLIQNPGNKSRSLSYSSGWDLITPSGWGNSFWITLIMWGARAGGLREFNSILFERGELPFFAPDTPAGNAEEKLLTETYKHRFFSLPPNKRPNYNKLGFIEPFTYNWQKLIDEWKSDTLPSKDFSVLRDKKILYQMQILLNSAKRKMETISFETNFLIPVRIKLENKGTIKKFAHICLPKLQDLTTDLYEPKRKDINEKIRKEKRDAHKKLLKRLRRARIKTKKEGKKVSRENVKEVLEYNNEMKKLWLPDLNNDLRTSCSRKIMGYITFGDFSFTQYCCCGVGYISMCAFKVLLEKQMRNKILVRNISSRRYRIGVMEIVT
ncbi:hypothetical protein FQA39_LY06518 [Lamprigera yunnana]|nr:hypothetical protein FQA39_LY06518 [Lamprigera yunnana]